ncbi:MAG: hypothetical protein ISS59_04470 [Desulfobacteraceae bacterium]|nr:hypothetical protein [Desulfobacteraceae bacterium]
MIRSTIISLTELKKPQITFDRFFDFDFTIIIALKKKKLKKPAFRAFAGVRDFVDLLPMKAFYPITQIAGTCNSKLWFNCDSDTVGSQVRI